MNVTQRLRDRRSDLIYTLPHRITRSHKIKSPDRRLQKVDAPRHTLHIGHRSVIFTTNRAPGVGDSSVTPAQFFSGDNLFN
ncbi:hypothetical protein [Microcoleus sp. S13C4]|uniref:hypothetical protein n=1 Tax=Microcoleus sp. S13C4 TaxID=3055410 RepID=UPI002FD38ECC